MVGYWIQLEEGFRDHPKLYKLADKLTITEALARGLMVSLWLWSITNALSGELTKYTSRAIAKAADWDGDPDAFVQALIDCAWMDKLDDGRTILHGWGERVELLVKTIEYKREQGRIRQQHLRERRREPLPIHTNDGTSDVTRDGNEWNCLSRSCVTREGSLRNGITKPNQRKEDEEEYKTHSDARTRKGNPLNEGTSLSKGNRNEGIGIADVNSLVDGIDEAILRGDFKEVYRNVLALEASPEEIEGCLRFMRMGMGFELIEEAFKRAARYHAKNPYPFAAECLDRWRKEGIATVDAAAEEDYLRDAMNGKHGPDAQKEAFEQTRKKARASKERL